MKKNPVLERFTVEYFIRMAIVTAIAFALAWFAVWQGIEFVEYDLRLSENNIIKAWQCLLFSVWGLFLALSPLWWLSCVCFSMRVFISKK